MIALPAERIPPSAPVMLHRGFDLYASRSGPLVWTGVGRRGSDSRSGLDSRSMGEDRSRVGWLSRTVTTVILTHRSRID